MSAVVTAQPAEDPSVVTASVSHNRIPVSRGVGGYLLNGEERGHDGNERSGRDDRRSRSIGHPAALSASRRLLISVGKRDETTDDCAVGDVRYHGCKQSLSTVVDQQEAGRFE
jgi:hypothetical protein